MTKDAWRRSPWDADPLSWFTTPNLPLAAAALTLVYGIVVLGPAGQAGSRPWVQVAALGLAVASMVWIHVVTRPRFGPLTVARVSIATAFAVASIVVSALGYRGEALAVELWWLPLAISLVLLAMVPYSSAARLATIGAILLAVASAVTLVLVVPTVTEWTPFSTLVITLLPVAAGLGGGIAMIRSITLSLARWSERPLEVPFSPPYDDDMVAVVDAATSARIAPALAMIRSVLERGEVTLDDTVRSASIAEQLRRDLLGEVDRSWIERVVDSQAVVVDDPERLAERLDVAQRTALRALLDALLGDPERQLGSARVELRRTDGGAIGVALRVVGTLPEGRRETFLAPYYVSLRSSVTKLRWRTGPITAVEFEVPDDHLPRTTMVHRTPRTALSVALRHGRAN